MSGKTTLTLVTGGTPDAREAAIAALLPDTLSCAILLEGLPSGRTLLTPTETLHIDRIAPGCLCCTGNLVLRVTLNRILRLRPERLYIGVASTDHLDQLRSWLTSAPYDQLLELTADISCT